MCVLAQHVVFIFLRPVISLFVRDISQIYRQSFIFCCPTGPHYSLWWFRIQLKLWIKLSCYVCHKWFCVYARTRMVTSDYYYYHYCTKTIDYFTITTKRMCTSRWLLKSLIFCLFCSLLSVHIINSVSWTMANFFWCASARKHLLAIDRHFVNFSSVILFWSTDMLLTNFRTEKEREKITTQKNPILFNVRACDFLLFSHMFACVCLMSVFCAIGWNIC